ncbi:ZIP Zinc transporter [Plasmodiophora brassicae]
MRVGDVLLVVAAIGACASAHGHGHSHAGHGHAHAGHGHSHGGHSHVPPMAVPRQGVRAEPDANLWATAMACTAVIGLAPVVIISYLPIKAGVNMSRKDRDRLKVLLGFAVGGLLGDVFLHLLPHADMSAHDDAAQHSHGTSGFWVLAGIMAFLIIEKAVHCFTGESGHGHSHSSAPVAKPDPVARNGNDGSSSTLRHRGAKSREKPAAEADTSTRKGPDSSSHFAVAAYLNLAADFAHNFTDGLAVGASFNANSRLGFITVLAIVLHEIPHEIGDFAILLQAGVSRKRAIQLQVLTAVGALAGTILGLFTGGDLQGAWVLPLTAGGFLYIAMSTVIPELLQQSTPKQSAKEVAAIAVGIGMMALISAVE